MNGPECTGVGLRRTPYELVFGPEQFTAGIFPRIAAEVESRQTPHTGSEAFVMLGSVGNLLRDLRPEATEVDAATGPPPEAIRQYGALTWQAFRFWQEGCPVYAFHPDVARYLLGDNAPIGDWRFHPPTVAGYIQLPRHLLWTRVEEGEAAEPVDGFHWTWLEANAMAGRAVPRLDLLVCVGLRPGRAGLSVIEITATPPEESGHWGDIQGRDEAEDFANILPGGELQEYHGIVSFAEVLKLVSRCFHWIESRPGSVQTATAGHALEGVEPAATMSRLGYRAVVPNAGDGR